MSVKLIDQKDTDGNLMGFDFSQIEVVRFGNTIRDKLTGKVWAIQDPYGDWVDPTMLSMGLKSVIVVEETDEDLVTEGQEADT